MCNGKLRRLAAWAVVVSADGRFVGWSSGLVEAWGVWRERKGERLEVFCCDAWFYVVRRGSLHTLHFPRFLLRGRLPHVC